MCNGVLFPGGNYPLDTTTTWFRAGEQLFDLAVQANDAGELFPVRNSCVWNPLAAPWRPANSQVQAWVLLMHFAVQVLGTCLGLQQLATIVTRDQYALVP